MCSDDITETTVHYRSPRLASSVFVLIKDPSPLVLVPFAPALLDCSDQSLHLLGSVHLPSPLSLCLHQPLHLLDAGEAQSCQPDSVSLAL